ncbi:MAG TPA: alpha/beta family hydrolase [Vicinamibacterales bacterium]|nr:alpha/beta family hydrolase [Vicinamibacterales bacterium]
MLEQLTISVGGSEHVSARVYRALDPGRIGATFVLAHGAGAGHLSAFMVRFATGLASRGLDVLTFNFLYTEQRRRVPDRPDKLEACYRAAIGAARGAVPPGGHPGGNRMYIGGKSMGGRIASQVAAGESAEPLSGLIFLGYPLHPPGKPDRLRAAHLAKIRAPMLFVQGARDPFGTPDELRPILDRLQAHATLRVVENGDHSLAPPKKGEPSLDDVYNGIQDDIVTWIRYPGRVLSGA